jgi:hypothetical protein
MAVRRAEWAADGEWWLVGADGGREAGRLSRATATLGHWVLLAWVVDSGARSSRHPLSRRYALVGAAQVGPQAFRALKGRLALPEGRHSAHTGQVPGSVAP